MKARVKATGEIVEVRSKVITSFSREHRLKYIDQDTGVSYFEEELFFPKDLVDDPDYWTRLEHQYAGMAMQSYVSNNVYLKEIREMCKEPQEMRNLIADLSILLARTLVEKMKEERQ